VGFLGEFSALMPPGTSGDAFKTKRPRPRGDAGPGDRQVLDNNRSPPASGQIDNGEAIFTSRCIGAGLAGRPGQELQARFAGVRRS